MSIPLERKAGLIYFKCRLKNEARQTRKRGFSVAPKFLFSIVLLVGSVGFLAIGGLQSSKSYYVTVDEMFAKADRLAGHKMKVAGVVSDESIERTEGVLSFRLERNGMELPVKYVGTDPVPDMFESGVEAVVSGYYRAPVFEAEEIQAKCASKYEVELGGEAPADATDAPAETQASL